MALKRAALAALLFLALVARAHAQTPAPPPTVTPTPVPPVPPPLADSYNWLVALFATWPPWVAVGLILAGVALYLISQYGQGWSESLKDLGKQHGAKTFTPAADPTRAYLEKFIDDYQDFKFRGLKNLARGVQLPELEQAYIFVQLMPELSEAEREAAARGHAGRSKAGPELMEGRLGEQKTIGLTEAIRQSPRLAVIGIAGSGKSTLLQWAGLTSARARLGQKLSNQEQQAFVTALGKPLTPIFFSLGAFDRFCQRHERRRAATALLDSVVERFNERHPSPQLTREFFDKLMRPGCLLLFDGMDEVAPEHRGQVREAIENLARDYDAPSARCLITSRTPAYFGEAQLADFRKCEVQPLTRSQRDELIDGLYAKVYPPDEAKRQGRLLSRQIDASDERVRQLARTPLLATIFALVHYDRRKLPERRAELYEEAVDTLLAESHRERDDEIGLTPGAREEFDPKTRRDRLSLIAFQLHERRIGDDGLLENDLLDIIWQEFGADPKPARAAASHFIHAVAARGGLLEERDRRFGFFTHHTFQEFLAGRYLAQEYAPNDLKKQAEFLGARLNDDHWEESTRLAAGYLAVGGRKSADQFISMVADLGTTETARARARALAGLCLADLPETRIEAATRDRLIGEMQAVLERTPPLLEPRLRRRLGLALGTLGDPRLRPGGLPELVTLPAGPFRMGTSDDEARRLKEQNAEAWDAEKPQHTVFVSEFAIGKYPVTNAEYRAFWEAKGCENRDYWSDDGWGWRTGQLPPNLSIYDDETRKNVERWLAGRPVERRDRPFYWDDPKWNAPNLPVVGVTWHEAEAYCHWLSQITGQPFRLPREAEWEKAARGQLQTPNLKSQTSGPGATNGTLANATPARANSMRPRRSACTPTARGTARMARPARSTRSAMCGNGAATGGTRRFTVSERSRKSAIRPAPSPASPAFCAAARGSVGVIPAARPAVLGLAPAPFHYHLGFRVARSPVSS